MMILRSVAGWLVLMAHSARSQDLVTCDTAAALSYGYLHQECPLSNCQQGIACPTDECIDSGDITTAVCHDGCTYTLDDTNYQVDRSVIGGHGAVDAGFGLIFQFLITECTYFSTGAEDNYCFMRDVTPELDGSIDAYVEGGSCTFTFNDQDCSCEQRYCDETQDSWGYFIDCSGLEGGAVINDCNAPDLSADSAPLEILYWLPWQHCNADQESGTDDLSDVDMGDHNSSIAAPTSETDPADLSTSAATSLSLFQPHIFLFLVGIMLVRRHG
jgi:hypothetical protein